MTLNSPRFSQKAASLGFFPIVSTQPCLHCCPSCLRSIRGTLNMRSTYLASSNMKTFSPKDTQLGFVTDPKLVSQLGPEVPMLGAFRADLPPPPLTIALTDGVKR